MLYLCTSVCVCVSVFGECCCWFGGSAPFRLKQWLKEGGGGGEYEWEGINFKRERFKGRSEMERFPRENLHWAYAKNLLFSNVFESVYVWTCVCVCIGLQLSVGVLIVCFSWFDNHDASFPAIHSPTCLLSFSLFLFLSLFFLSLSLYLSICSFIYVYIFVKVARDDATNTCIYIYMYFFKCVYLSFYSFLVNNICEIFIIQTLVVVCSSLVLLRFARFKDVCNSFVSCTNAPPAFRSAVSLPTYTPRLLGSVPPVPNFANARTHTRTHTHTRSQAHIHTHIYTNLDPLHLENIDIQYPIRRSANDRPDHNQPPQLLLRRQRQNNNNNNSKTHTIAKHHWPTKAHWAGVRIHCSGTWTWT